MSTSFLVGIALYFVALMASRVFTERALRTLDTTQKATFMGAFSAMRIYALVPLLVLFLLYFVISRQGLFVSSTLLLIFWLLLVVYLIAVQWFSARKIKRLNLPTEFNRNYGIARACSLGGLALLVSFVLYQL
ncbi:MAG: hypothetical protein HOP19_24825 [Acidobacteria bacterium]|nr:hypothetical protein [Acidobacteriota bacterium]